MRSKLFVKYFLTINGGILLLILLFNLLVDPFGVERLYNKKGFNRYKEAFHMNTRVTKLPLSKKSDPRTLFFGSSRTEYLAPEQELPLEDRNRSFNFGLSGGTVHEMRDLLKWAIDRYPVQEVYYGIDFISMTDRTSYYRKGFDQELVRGKQPLWAGEGRFFLTWTALMESWNCIEQNRRDPEGETVRYQYNLHGSRTNRWRRLALKERGKKWLSSEFERIHQQYKRLYNREKAVLSKEKQKAFKEMIGICSRNEIDFKAFIPPIHQSQFSSLLRSPSFQLYKDFLSFLSDNGGVYYFQRKEALVRDSSNFWDSQHPRAKVAKSVMPSVLKGRTPENGYVTKKELQDLIAWLEEERGEAAN